MGIKTVQDTSLTSVANAIRVKAEISGTLEFPDEFVSAIQNISTGITPSGTKTITENGTYDVTNFASADVNVSGGGGSANIGTATTTTATEASSAISTVTFTGLQGEPKCFFLRCTFDMFRSSGNRYYYIIAMSYDGTGYQSTTYYQTSGTTYNNNSSTEYSFTYSNGTLEIKSTAGKSYKNGGFYPSVGYSLVYVY